MDAADAWLATRVRAMSKSIASLLLTFVAACSGHFSMPSLIAGSSSTPSSDPGGSRASASSTSASRDSGGEESYSLAEPPGFKDDTNLVTMPKFFQGSQMYGATLRGAWKAFWLADVLGDQLGENARMILVHWCLKERNDLAYMACAGDAHRLDRARLATELDVPAARKFRKSAFEHFDAVVKEVAVRDAQIAQRVKEDPALAQVYQVIPGAVWKQWDAVTVANGALLATARRLEIASQKRQAFDDKGPSRKAYAGCLDELAPQFAKAVRGTTIEKATSFIGTFKIATTPTRYLTTLAMYYCALGNDLGITGALGSELTEGEMLRGPRMATIEAVLAKSQSLQFDDKNYAISPWRDANYINEDEQLIADNAGSYGVIKTVQRDGDHLHITFVSEPFSYDDCVRTVPSRNEWHYDRATGNLAPVEVCAQWVTKKAVQETGPIDLPAAQGAGVQPGRFLEWGTAHKAVSARAVWDSAKQKRAFAIYGVAR